MVGQQMKLDKENTNCNGWRMSPTMGCICDVESPPTATSEMILLKTKERLLSAIAETEQCFKDYNDAVKKQPQVDNDLLRECLEVLEYATYHDGRYGQVKNETFQKEAQPLVIRIAKRLGVKAYDGFK